MSPYSKPPVVEVVFELFHNPSNWDATLPGLFWGKIKEKFPKKHSIPNNNINVEMGADGIQVSGTPTDISRFDSANGEMVVQLRDGLLSIHRTKPYTGWSDFFPTIQEVLESYQEMVPIASVTKLTLRYINRLDNEEHNLKSIGEVLTIAPKSEVSLPWNTVAVNNVIEFLVSEKDRVAVRYATLMPDEISSAPIYLEITYITAEARSIKAEDIPAWLGNAHDSAVATFEEVVTSKLKSQF